jgi:hypothetical protein
MTSTPPHRPHPGRYSLGRRGTASVEFAAAGGLLVTSTMGLIAAGLMSWTSNGLEAAASATARCVALAAPDCATPETYAVTLAGRYVFPGIIASRDVTVTQATTCNGATGRYAKVAISTTHWAGTALRAGMANTTVSVTSCYLSGT